jgi:hypothetical protein
MNFGRRVVLALLIVALASYALDCGAAVTPEEAMQCCDSMDCSSQGHHGEDCCKTMPEMHAPFVQPSSTPALSFSPFVFAVLPASNESHGIDSCARVIAALAHAPPAIYLPASRPLRI